MNVRFGAEIAAAAAAHHLDPRLLAAVAAQETGGPGSNSGHNIVGDAGHGRGVFQIDDRSWSFARTRAAMDPARNADMAASILADNLQRYRGDVRAALCAYNSGSPTARGTTTTWQDGATLGYADSVLRHYASLAGDTHAQLVADSRETSTGINALAAYGASRTPSAAGATAGAPTPAASTAGAPAPALSTAFTAPHLGASPASPATLPPLGPFTQMPSYAMPPVSTPPPSTGATDAAGADADSRMASIVDGDDPAPDASADDSTTGAR